MNKRTFEIIAKWGAKFNGAQVQFKSGATPQASIKTNVITLPTSISDENKYGALSTLLHESAHLRYTKELPDKMTNTPQEHNVLNVIEDVRIDQKNFHLLDNVKDCYRIWLNDNHTKWPEPSKRPLQTRVCVRSILDLEGFNGYKQVDPQAEAFDNKHNITAKIATAVDNLNAGYYPEAKKLIKEITDIFGRLPKEEQSPPPQQGEGNGSGKGEGKGEGELVEEGVGEYLKPGKDAWKGQGKENMETSFSDLGSEVLQEITKQRFKEILNIKEHRWVSDGNILDTDNLDAFLTGNVDELFKEDKIEHKKKSKILFCMDASGSMSARLMDKQTRKKVTAGCVQQLTDTLDEVIQTEGLNVEYEMRAFNCNYHKLDKGSWQSEYWKYSGGTSMINAFIEAQKELLSDPELEGRKMIIFFTDGDVSVSEVEDMKKRAIRHNADVRTMVIGVGAELGGGLVREVVGDANILAGDLSDVILMESIMIMLGG